MKAKSLRQVPWLLLLASSLTACGKKDDDPEKKAEAPDEAPAGLDDCRVQGTCEVAGDLDRSVATTLTEAAAYLYTGDHPLQHDVDEGAIDQRRIALLHGVVKDTQDEPLLGAVVRVVGHPEWGWTYSRSNGAFDLVVNGGGRVVLEYSKADQLPVQRAVQPGWQRYESLPTVTLAPRSDKVSALSSHAGELQVAEATKIIDDEGERRPLVLFQPETEATAHLPDGTEALLDELHVRISEYPFQGSSDPDGDFSSTSAGTPTTTGLSYGLAFSVDEAEELGASSISFNKPVTLYAENFLQMDTGSEIPFGYYSPDSGTWEQDQPMLVVAIVSEAGGEAELDLDGDGAPEPRSDLEKEGILPSELEALAARYEPGQTLWRARLSHFSEYQGDFPIVAPPTASAPSVATPQIRPLATTTRRGLARVESQAVTQTVALSGTPYSLHYQSDRTTSLGAAFDIEVPLIGQSIPEGLVDVLVTVSVAGQKMSAELAPAANLSHIFAWDGRDALGRLVQGQQRAKITTTYRYPGEIRVTLRNDSGYGTAKAKSGGIYSTLKQTIEVPVGTWDAGGYELGGFGLDMLHAYDPVHHSLHFGDGDSKYAENIALVVDRPAFNENLGTPDSIAIAPDGSAILSDDAGARLLRVAPDESVTVLAGKGAKGPAADWRVGSPQGVALKSNGAIWVADFHDAAIWELGLSGKMRAILGRKGIKPLVVADLPKIEGIAFGPSEELYIVSTPQVYRLRGTTLELFAGGGDEADGGDGGPAIDAELKVPSGIAVAPDGTVYISERDGHRIRKILPNGTIFTYAGTGEPGFSGDGSLAANAQLDQPRGLALGPDGSLYFSDRANSRIRVITPDGRIQTLAGGGETKLSAEEQASQLATDVAIELPDGIALAQDGTIWSSASTGLYRVRPGTPDVLGGQSLIPSQDGRTLYKFDVRGKHLATFDALTAVAIHKFTYNAQGFLTQITDRNGLVTKVVRASNGRAKQIVGPFGQTTTLTMEGSRLVQITDPIKRETLFSYDEKTGLLTLAEDAEHGQYAFEFDKTDRLLSVTDPTGYAETYKRTKVPGGHSVGVTTASGRTIQFLTAAAGAGTLVRSVIGFDGQTREMTDNILSQTTYSPDGTSYFTVLAADPAFGPQSVYTASAETTTPSGRTHSVSPLRLKQVTDGENLLSLTEWSEVVDVNGRLYEATYNRAARTLTTISPEGRKSTTTFDAFGNPTKAQSFGLAKRTWTYDGSGLPTGTKWGGAKRQRSVEYNAQGYTSLFSNELKQETTFARDLVGRIQSTGFADGTESGVTWDLNDNVLSVTPPGSLPHKLDYTDAQLLKSMTPPRILGGAAGVGAVAFQYGTDNELAKITRADGRNIAFRYDSAKRLDRTTIGDVRLSYGYDLVGRVASVNRSDSVKVASTFDGPLWTRDAWTGAVKGTVAAAYDDNFWMTELTVNAQSTAHFTHDNDGLIVQASVGTNVLSLTRDAATGFVSGTELGAVTTARSYSTYGELATLSAQASDGLFAQAMTRDALGRVTTLTETVDNAKTDTVYAYDKVGQLTTTKRGADVTKYTYDLNGNRTAITFNGAAVAESTFDEQDRILTYGPWEYSYTDAGDLQRRTDGIFSAVLTYDPLGNLLQVSSSEGAWAQTISYVVDGRGRRVARRVDGAFDRAWLYQDALRPVSEVRSDGTFTHFVYAQESIGGAPEFMVQGGVAYRFVKDHLGSVRRVVKASDGAVVQQLDFDEFGKVLIDSNPGFQPFGFAGGLYDSDTGLTRFGARDYDPALGRWTAKDLIGFSGGQANVYTYVANDPVNRVDPTGEWGFNVGVSFGGGRGVATDVSFGIAIDYANGNLTVANYRTGAQYVGVGGYLSASVEVGLIASNIEKFSGASVVAKGTYGEGLIASVNVSHGGSVGVGPGKLGFGGGTYVGVGLSDTKVSGFQIRDFFNDWGLRDVVPFSRDARWLP